MFCEKSDTQSDFSQNTQSARLVMTNILKKIAEGFNFSNVCVGLVDPLCVFFSINICTRPPKTQPSPPPPPLPPLKGPSL